MSTASGGHIPIAHPGSALGLMLAVAIAGFGLSSTTHAQSENMPKSVSTPYSGGETTRFATNDKAFTLPAANLPLKDARAFFFGNRIFNTGWVVAPASVKSLDGLGPVFNRTSCSGCHLRDGRGRPPAQKGDPFLSMLIRVSVPGTDSHGGPNPHPAYGDQLNDRAIPGVPAEGRAIITYRDIPGTYGDGSAFSLRQPTYTFSNLAFGPLGKNILVSPRVAPAVYGLGLLEAIPESAIRAQADPGDKDGDGISGRVNHVWDVEAGRHRLGRFGWKANQPSLRQQNAGAAAGDIGLTSMVFPDPNCRNSQAACRAAHAGGKHELNEQQLEKMTFYTQVLAPPARRNLNDPAVRRGEELFGASGCASCHTPRFTTRADAVVPLLSGQKITPYTDLLLHDMGDGLADGRPDFLANGREWRTPPLWGVGLVETVNKHTLFLHDGRARGFAEAILWHDGEAKASREAFRTMKKSDRAAMVAFLKSL